MAGIKDVAKKAGVSISTVSNVINDTKYVSEELKERIIQTIAELRYEVDPVARSLKSKRTMSIGVVITNISRVFFTQVIKGIQDTASKNGYNLTFCNTDDHFEVEKRFVQMLKSNWVDGIILASVADMGEDDYFKHLSSLGSKKKSIPIVCLERRVNGVDSVVVNNCLGGSIATRHLIDCGCSKIAHITGPLSTCMAEDRLKGYRNELEKDRLEIDAGRIVEGDFSPLSGYQAMKHLLLSGVQIDGLFAANDQMAIGAIKAIKEHGYSVPEDIKVAGFDNTFVASIVEPSLTTINVPKYKLGTDAVEILIKKMTQGLTDTTFIELPINLVVRQSTDLKGDKNWDLYGW